MIMTKSFVITFLTIFYFLGFSLIEAQNDGFSVDLIHRESIESPFHNISRSLSDRVSLAVRRSVNRLNHFYPTSMLQADTLESQILSAGGEYLIKMSIGTPPREILATADTGSDLIWTQCKPCTGCNKQDSPLFDPKSSRTYKSVSCQSRQCKSTSIEGKCSSGHKTCQYMIKYGDKSFSHGQLALDTFWLGSNKGRRPLAFPNKFFGCGFHNGGSFRTISNGIVGLGNGELSLIYQMKSSIKGKFSYCLLQIESSSNTSKLGFGSHGVVSGPGVVSTPLHLTKGFYHLELQAITIGNRRINVEDSHRSRKAHEGNIIIDSGTTITWLDTKFYAKLEKEMVNSIHGLRRVRDPDNFLGLCYKGNLSTLKLPSVTIHFRGVDLKLKSYNSFVQNSDTTFCFAFKGSTSSDGQIYGNLAQVNFLVGHDLIRKTVSFKPTDCTKY